MYKIKNKYFFLLVLTAILYSGCNPSFNDFAPNPGSIVLDQSVFLGGDFMTGYTDGALAPANQKNSIAYLLYQKFLMVDSKQKFSQYLIVGDKGYGLNFPNTNPAFYNAFHLGHYTDCKGVTSLFPLHEAIPTTDNDLRYNLSTNSNTTYYNNLCVPYAKITDYDDASLGNSYLSGGRNPYFTAIAHQPGVSTMLGDAMKTPFTFFALWPGMEDVYNYALRGGEGETITDFTAFDNALDHVLNTLQLNGAKGIMANIPDLDVFPFFTYIPYDAAVLNQQQVDSLVLMTGNPFGFQVGSNGFIIKDSSLSPIQYRHLMTGEYVLLSAPPDSLKCDGMGVLTPVPGHYILDHFEVDKIKAAIQHYNSKIHDAAAARNMPVVDMNAYFHSIKNGIYNDGIHYTADFISGAFYSLDGYHPTAQGYGLLTNEFIKRINDYYHATVPMVNVPSLPGIIFP
ncbi:MAG: hypothetical protein WCL14_12390 [Bacteroidota bacterium]